MALTPVQQMLIEKPFMLREHGFNGDEPYVFRLAIYHRLNEIDSAWTMGKQLILNTGDDFATIALPLTIAGETRWGIGKVAVERSQGASSNGLGKARNAATAEAFANAFAAFGGADYLKVKPGHVNRRNFATWLTELTPKSQPINDPVSPAPAVIENLDDWFPLSSKTVKSAPTADSPVDKLNSVYARREKGFLTGQRDHKNPHGTSDTITSFRIHPNDVEEGDIYRNGNGPITKVIKDLTTDRDEPGTRVFRVEESEERSTSKTERTITITTSLVMFIIVGGPKIEDANNNSELLESTGVGPTWIGKKAKAAS